MQAVAGEVSHFRSWKASEQVGPELFKHLRTMKEGDIVVDDESNPRLVRVIMLYASEPNPLDPRESQSVVSAGILHDKQEEAARNLVSNLRSQADISFGAKAAPTAADQNTRIGQASKTRVVSKRFRLADFWTAWISALFVLLPASLISFHRLNIRARDEAYFVDHDFSSFLLNRIRLFTLSPVFQILLFFIATVMTLAASAAMISAYSLGSDTVLVASMAVSGIVSGLILSLLWWRYSQLLPRKVSQNRWVPILMVLSVQTAGFLAAVSAL